MKRRRASREHGAALLALLAVLALGASWFLVSRLNAETGAAGAAVRERNALVLQRAKQALIGYIAAQAVKAGENNPGAMPCPENPGDFDSTTGRQGLVGTSCTTTTIGRFPWRTLGLEQLTDASGEALWYVVGPGWGAASGTNTSINSNSTGQLTVDGAANAAIALIIAPGPAISVQTTTGCAARNQIRPATGTPDWRDYLECENATYPTPDATFVTRGPSASFNDQVISITVADVMPAIEASIANRIQREIVPALNSVYTPAGWGFAGSNALYPFAAAFNNPGPGTGTSNYQGNSGTYQGLLPFNQTQGCSASASNPRCLPGLIGWSGGYPNDAYEVYGWGYIQTMNCDWSATDVWECVGEYHENTSSPWLPIRLELRTQFNNVAMGLRAIDASKITIEAKDNIVTGPWQALSPDYTVTMDSGGRATLVFGATMPNIDAMGWGSYANFRIRIDRAVIGDHPLLDPNNAVTGWFVRNEWFRLAYYAIAQGFSVAPLPSAPACVTGNNCLAVANLAPANAQRAILVLGGRSLNGVTRPSATAADYFESGNASGAFTNQKVTTSSALTAAQRFNDRIVVLGSN
jgi:hypothetical protein